jgi:beta-N-acetylhexosaminidase
MITQHDAARMMMVGFEGTEPSPDLRQFVHESPPLGVVLFGRNIESTEQVASLVRQLRALWPKDEFPLIAIDQEGGPVRRLKSPECPDFAAIPAMRAIGLKQSVQTSYEAGRVTALQLAALGFNLNFAPVLDVDTNPDNPIINRRSFSRDPQWVAKLGVACAQGLEDGGVLGCGKHFPGHGDTSVDSHLGLPSLPHSRNRLETVEWPPFRAAIEADIPSLMSAHIVFETLDNTLPATLSPTVLPTILRTKMNYQGVLFSDDLEMAAIAEHFGWSEIAERGLQASIDVFLVCRHLQGARELRAALVDCGNKSISSASAMETSLERNERLRRRATDHASKPWNGVLPAQGEAMALIESIESA